MESDRSEPEPEGGKHDRRLLIGLLVLAAATLVYVARVVDQHSIQIVAGQHLLPRWDLATHLDHGWEDYHLLITGQIHWLLWDLWLQGYWPPVLSLWQIPFYLVFGGHIVAGLRSALGAFVLTGLLGCVLMWQQWRSAALLPAAMFLALLLSSPYILAYASVTMTEIAGAAAQLAVAVAYVAYRQRPTPSTARAFAISLTVLFFTKYNYFFLLVVPLVVSEWLERSEPGDRIEQLRSWSRRALSSPTVWLLVLYGAALLLVMRTGGFEFRIAGKRISIHTVGNSGHVVLYGLLARLWYLHRGGRFAWQRIFSRDLRVRPFVVWFAVPVTIWLASPYPNHIRDFFNLVINRPLGEATIGAGATVYVEALRDLYFYREGILIAVICLFAIAAFGYRRQPAVMRWLILAIPLQFSAIALHQTRFPRFLLLTVVVLCVAAASETGRWIAGVRVRRIIAAVGSPLVLGAGVLAAKSLVVQGRFHDVAFENYTDNHTLAAALRSIRADFVPADRLAIIGQSNELSPALFRWELGPPSGLACSPFELGGARGIDLRSATRVLLLTPLDSSARLDVTTSYLAQRALVHEQNGSGRLELVRELPLSDMHVGLQFYRRTSQPTQQAPCR